MLEIKPDTSLYTDLPNKLRAFAAISEAGGDIECRDCGVWRSDTLGYSVKDRLALLVQDRDYRIKPKPRELWAVYEADGTYSGCAWESEDDATEYVGARGRTVVRLVEPPQ